MNDFRIMISRRPESDKADGGWNLGDTIKHNGMDYKIIKREYINSEHIKLEIQQIDPWGFSRPPIGEWFCKWRPDWERLHDEEDVFKPHNAFFLNSENKEHLCVSMLLVNSPMKPCKGQQYLNEVIKVKQSIRNYIND